MYAIRDFSPREYQQNIVGAALNKNTLVCLPTGTGKTKVAIMVLVDRLNRYENSKSIIISPTKPLASQIAKEITSSTSIPSDKIILLTGMISPDERKKQFDDATVIVATPQTIQFDVEKKRISLDNVSLLVVDECHRSMEHFANTQVARLYQQQRTDGQIFALTASPGATKEKVKEVCDNLFIEHIELRTEEDNDLVDHIQERHVENIKVQLTPEMKTIQELLRNHYKSKAGGLKKYRVNKPASAINKTDLLRYQREFQVRIKQGDVTAYRGVSEVAELIKTQHAIGLIETQTPRALDDYFKKVGTEKSRAASNLLKNANVVKAKEINDALIANKTKHPKVVKLLEVMAEEYKKDTTTKTIIFANYRATVKELKEELEQIEGILPTILVGQKDGVSQKDQLATIEKFNQGVFNVLICTSIGEEGLSMGSLDVAIFYDHTASEIRKIQRSGRVARIRPGKIINLIAEKTLDEAMLWTAKRKEVKMHNLLKYMQRGLD